MGGDFFESIPNGADAYLLKHILHDWSDEDCLRILKNIYAVAEPGTKLLIVDAVIGARNEHEFAKTLDMQMLVLTHEGKERTHAEWKELLHSSAAAARRVFWFRPVMTTWAPSATKSRAVAKPMPLLPPATIAIFPSSFPIRLICNVVLFDWYRFHHVSERWCGNDAG